MAEHQDHTEDHGQAHYIKIWAVLLVLLVLSVVGPIVAPFLAVGFLEAWMITLLTAFGIAIVKAYLVAANFMHLNVEKKYITYMLSAMLMFMLLFFAGTAPDVMEHKGQNWENVAAEAEVQAALKAQAEQAAQGEHGGEHDSAAH